MTRYRITLVEYERGRGSDWFCEHLDSLEEAKARIAEINSHNNPRGPVPDYFVMAEDHIEEVEA